MRHQTKIVNSTDKMTSQQKKSYELDKDGYVVIEFFDHFGKLIIEENEEKSLIWNEVSNADPKLVKKVNSKKITKENILDFELTGLVRGAYYNDYLKKCIRDYMNLRPLPIKTHIYNSQGKKVECKLFPHQEKALTFMKERESLDPKTVYGLRGGIIKMCMGLGKSLTAITHSLISERPPCEEEHGENGFPTLIIASKTVMLEWKSQGFEKFFESDNVKVLYLHRDYMGKSIDSINRREVVKYDFVISTYDVCSSICRKFKYHEEGIEMGDEHTLMSGKIVSVHCRARKQSDKPKVIGPSIIYTTPWQRCYLDESQRISNPDTKTYRHIMGVYARYKWCLTGTPIRNTCTDIWSQLRFCCYLGVDRKIEWKRNGYQMMKAHNLTNAILSMNYEGANIKIPPKHEHPIRIQLGKIEQECYDYVKGVAKGVYNQMMNGLVDFASILALFTRLRQCSIAPYLLTKESKREKGTIAEREKDKEATDTLNDINKGDLGEWVYNKMGTAGINSTKMKQIVTTISNIPGKEKVLIFSMFTSVLDLLSDALKENLSNFEFVQIDGDTKGKERERLLNQFRYEENTRGLLMTYKVGSEGLNLTEANHVICIEPWWTNAVHNQAISRCHRTGQIRDVEIHNIYIKNSIEEDIVEICKEKDKISNSILEAGQKITRGVGLDKYT